MVRYFSYIDEHTIDSFYNQFDDSYDLVRKTVSKGKSFNGEAKISLKNIILGFLDGEGRVMSELKRGSSEEVERSVKIEKKIMRLLEIADGDENIKINIDNLKSVRQLICGTIQVIECNVFLECVSKIYNKKILSYDDFLENYETKREVLWKDVTSNLSYDNILGNGVSPLKIMNSWSQIEDGLFSFVIIDNTYPVIMDMSYKKVTMTHSTVRSSAFFCHLTKFSALGVLTKINSCFYLKPLALWNIIDTEVV